MSVQTVQTVYVILSNFLRICLQLRIANFEHNYPWFFSKIYHQAFQINIYGRLHYGPSYLLSSYPHTLTSNFAVAPSEDTVLSYPMTLSSVLWRALANNIWPELTILFYISRSWCHQKKNIPQLGHKSKKDEKYTGDSWTRPRAWSQASLIPD